MALTFLTALLLVVTPALSVPVKVPQCPDYCKGTSGNDSTYVCGDFRLGPVDLPSKLPLSNDVYGYDRFGGQCPGAFLTTWWNASDGASGNYIYPPSEGFQLQTDNSPLRGNVTLPAGALLDRFGGEGGNYLAPFGTPYEQRALPPWSLDTRDGLFPYQYHVYEVLQPLVVAAGPIAPWFDQPGQGTQYKTDNNVTVLIANGSIRVVNQTELLAPALGS